MRQKRKHLRWFDIGAITALLFGAPIASSTLTLLSGEATPYVEFSSDNNVQALVQQGVMLAASMGYLALRRFDFAQWKLTPTWRGSLQGAGIFLALGAMFDIYYTVLQQFVDFVGEDAVSSPVTASLLGYSALNSVYEELFFLGVCLCVATRYRVRALWYSIAVRTSFHTYMGLPTAAGIGLGAGLFYYAAYMRLGTLYPLIVAHALADVFGSSLLGLFYR